jgi:hypothetical protein
VNIKKVQDYFFNVIGIEIQILPLGNDFLNKLNYQQKKIFQYYKVIINNNDFILIIFDETHFTPNEIKNNVENIKRKLNRKVIIVKNKINSYDRIRLIKYKIGFIIPNKHLYIPEMLIDLRESFDIEKIVREKFTPSTQFILIFHLLKHNLSGKTLNEVIEIIDNFNKKNNHNLMNYSKMTINRAFNELKYFKICNIERKKGMNYLFFPKNKKKLLHKAKKFMINPISKKIRLYKSSNKLKLKLYSGITALSKYTLIAPENIKTFAMYKKQFNEERIPNNMEFNEYFNLELWEYNPFSLSLNKKTVDPISLYFSLKGSKDERISKSLENLLKNCL